VAVARLAGQQPVECGYGESAAALASNRARASSRISAFDEIDEVLEENAEEFFRSHVQQGGPVTRAG
jgi:ubiquitin-like protein Pup